MSIFLFQLRLKLSVLSLFRSVIMTPYVLGDQMLLPFLTYTIQYPIVVALLFLNFFADAKPKYVDLNGKHLYLLFLI